MRIPAFLKHPVVVFLLRFVLVLVLAQLLFVNYLNESELFIDFFVFNARNSAFLLNLIGVDVAARGCLVIGNGHSIQVAFGCDGSQALIVFVACVLAYPASVLRRLAGIGIGIPALLFVNAVRIASLYWVQVNHPAAFDNVHLFLWPAVFMACIFLLWSQWIRWVLRPQRES